MKRQSKQSNPVPAAQDADKKVAILGMSCLTLLMLRNLILADKWEQYGCRDYQDFVARTGVPESLAVQGMSIVLQQKLFTNAAREHYGREKINQLDQVLSYELEGLTLAKLISRVTGIFGEVAK